MIRSTRAARVAVLAAVLLAGSACSSKDDPAATPTTQAPAVTTETEATTAAAATEVTDATDSTEATDATEPTDTTPATAAETTVPEAPRGGTVTMVAAAAPASLDPAASLWGPTAPFYEAVYDTLLRMNPDGTVQPWLATAFEYDDAHTTLTLTLRDDVTFTDGSALTADVVVQNLQRFKDGAATNAPKLAGITAIDAPDDATVVITLAAPDPALLSALAQDAGLVASGQALANPDLATAPVGSGPYVLDTGATVIGSTYTYNKNSDYWNPDAQYLDSIVIRATADPISIINAAKAGEIDLSQVPSADARTEMEGAGWTVEEVKQGGFNGLMLFDRGGTIAAPLADVRVRQAINYALDRDALVEVMGNGGGAATTQVFPEYGQAFDAALDDAYPYDPEKAKELLAEAGYPDGFSITMPDLGLRDTFVFIEQMLGDVGITIDWEATQLADSIGQIMTGKYAMTFFALGAPTDWETVQQVIAPTASFNPFKSEDPELDALIEQLRLGDGDAARAINEYIVEQAWFAPVLAGTSIVGHGPRITLVNPTTQVLPSIYDIRVTA